LSDFFPDKEYWLALARAPGIGPVSFLRLLERFGNPREVFAAGRSQWYGLKSELISYLQSPDWEAVEKDLQWLETSGCQLLTLTHAAYPQRLRDIHDPPPVLFVRGDCSLLSSLQLAMVGTRRPSRHGEETAREFAQYLSKAGFTITSGLALGIDAACHRGALAGSGKTIAVAGTGLDRVYPAQHRELAHQIAQQGALVSEFFPGTLAKPTNFPRRNRVISGLSLGTLVVEAPLHSGSLYTAHQALEQGREIFAIPGHIHNPLIKGCHQLIKEGAKLVENAADIVEELLAHLPSLTVQPVPHKSAPANLLPDDELEPEYVQLLDFLATPTSIDNLVELSGLTAEAISSRLLILELRGLVAVQTGGLYVRFKNGRHP